MESLRLARGLGIEKYRLNHVNIKYLEAGISTDHMRDRFQFELENI
jgi:hypothetical protein